MTGILNKLHVHERDLHDLLRNVICMTVHVVYMKTRNILHVSVLPSDNRRLLAAMAVM